jgi:cytochrome d ubiquinol oxidase subunit II
MTLITIICILAFFLVLGLVVYAVLDGFDLGIGNTFLCFKKEHRGKLMDTIAPLWDGNETWLIYVGTIGVAAFPVVYFGVLPSLYIPAILMVAGLFIRGLSFEFRLKAQGEDKKIWDFTFFLGSFLASFLQGVLFAGAFVGLNMKDGVYLGGVLDFITPFNIVSGILTVVVYSILGLSFARYKMDGEVAESAVRMIKPLVLISFIGTFVMEGWLLYSQEGLKEQFFNSNLRVGVYALLSILAFFIFIFLLKSLKEKSHTVKTFILTTSIFLTSLTKKVFIMWPYLLFPNYTIFEAANSEPAMRLTFWIIIVMLPVVILCSIITYTVFKGKLQKSDQFYS